jgi:chaperonin cofactor prefoldin
VSGSKSESRDSAATAADANPSGGGRFPRQNRSGAAVPAAELLERLERQAERLGDVQTRLKEALQALNAERAARRTAAAALSDARARVDAAEEAFDRERTSRIALEREIQEERARVQALDSQVELVWAQIKALEAELDRSGQRWQDRLRLPRR